ncbi:hypothetical protein [Bacillus sonorensis]|uniref:hypothetical protein n=1 Tax=Bacillus sonorensis TaxID=119858 RepID=UPI00098A9DAC|nr:hypothetical protein [Bacillus sonorensis]
MLEFLKDYAVYLVPILSSYLTYLFLRRKSTLEKYEEQAKESLHDSCGPLLFSLNRILNKTSKIDMEFAMEEFLKKYSDDPSPLIKTKNRNIIDSYNNVERHYYIYTSCKNDNTYQKLLEQLLVLKMEIQNEFDIEHKVVNNGYKWFQLAARQENYWIKSLIHFYRGFSQTVIFFTYVDLFLFYLFIVDNHTEEKFLKPFQPYFISFTVGILVTFIVVISINFSIHETEGKFSPTSKIFSILIRDSWAQKFRFFRRFKVGDTKVNNENKARKIFVRHYRDMN